MEAIWRLESINTAMNQEVLDLGLKIVGKLISAQWDPWENLEAFRKLLCKFRRREESTQRQSS